MDLMNKLLVQSDGATGSQGQVDQSGLQSGDIENFKSIFSQLLTIAENLPEGLKTLDLDKLKALEGLDEFQLNLSNAKPSDSGLPFFDAKLLLDLVKRGRDLFPKDSGNSLPAEALNDVKEPDSANESAGDTDLGLIPEALPEGLTEVLPEVNEVSPSVNAVAPSGNGLEVSDLLSAPANNTIAAANYILPLGFNGEGKYASADLSETLSERGLDNSQFKQTGDLDRALDLASLSLRIKDFNVDDKTLDPLTVTTKDQGAGLASQSALLNADFEKLTQRLQSKTGLETDTLSQSLRFKTVMSETVFGMAKQISDVSHQGESSKPELLSPVASPAMTASQNTSGISKPSSESTPGFMQSMPERSPQWASQLNSNIKLMINSQLQEAKIAVDPPELGPINVRISLQQNEVQVHFSAQHAQTRDALEYALPRLRDMLDASGFSLADAGFSGHEQSGSEAKPEGRSKNEHSNSERHYLSDQNEQHDSLGLSLPLGVGAVDYYA